MNANTIPIAILAGGKSRRMGRDKAFVKLPGPPMIQWVITAVAQCSGAASIMFDEFRLGLNRVFTGEDELRKVDPDLRTFLNVNRPEDLQATAGFLA